MDKNLFKTDNLIELHEQLNEFANHHQNIGGQNAHRLVKSIWDEVKSSPRDGSQNGIIASSGFDDAMRIVLDALHKKFIP